MSCAYRKRRARRAVTGSDHSGIETHDAHPQCIDHSGNVPHTSIPVSDPSVSPVVWDMIGACIGSSHVGDRQLAVNGLLELIRFHGPQGIPPLTDAQIAHMWDTLQQCLPNEPISEPDRRLLAALLTIHASDAQRCVLWDSIRERYSSESDAVIAALQSGIPLWMVPGGIEAVRRACVNHPGTYLAVDELLDMLPPDIPIDTHSLLTEILLPPIPDEIPGYQRRARINAVRHIIDRDPNVVAHHPALADMILSECSRPDTATPTALDVVAAIRPFEHPRFASIMNYLASTSADGIVRSQAARMLAEYLIQANDPEQIRTVIETEWNIATNPNLPWTQRVGAETMVEAILGSDRYAPVLCSYLRQVEPSTLPQSLVRLILESPQHSGITGELMRIAQWAVTNRDTRDAAIAFFRRAWGRGYDRDIFETLATLAASVPRRDDVVEGLAPGLYDPLYGPRIVRVITAMDSDRFAHHLLRAVAQARRSGEALPSEVLHAVVTAYTKEPNEISSGVWEAIWDTNPFVAMSLITTTVARNDVGDKAHMQAIRSVSAGWGRGVDDSMTTLTASLLQNQAVVKTSWMAQELACSVIDGIGVGDSRCVLDAWHQIVRSVPSLTLPDIVEKIAFFPHIWERGHAHDVLSMHHELYGTYCSDQPGDRKHWIIVPILRSVKHGWGMGVDPDIRFLINDMLHHIMREPPPDEYGAVTIARQFLRTLRFGWGHGDDRAVAEMIQTVLTWLDQNYPKWDESVTGIPTVRSATLAIIAGGGDPTCIPPTEIPNESILVSRETFHQLRNLLTRMLSHGDHR